jgi:hypothetical protein
MTFIQILYINKVKTNNVYMIVVFIYFSKNNNNKQTISNSCTKSCTLYTYHGENILYTQMMVVVVVVNITVSIY